MKEQSTRIIRLNYRLHASVIIVIITVYLGVLTIADTYHEDQIAVMAPALGFVLIMSASLSRTLRVLCKGKAPEYVWKEYDLWKFSFEKAEKIALMYGVSLFSAGFFCRIVKIFA